MKKILITLISIVCFSTNLISQNVNIDNIKDNLKKPFKINGGVSLGAVYYAGNDMNVSKQPFTWFLNGNVNLSFFGLINAPFSINLTNLGTKMAYPSLPNRLSLHPSYKWATAHIGDVAMTFSPYTLSGHQFTGGGVELTPTKFKIGLMGGRLMKEVKSTANNPALMPNYARFGYGAQFQYDDSKFSVGMTFFTGKDKKNNAMSLQLDSMGITPQQNVALSWNFVLNVVKNLNLKAEYGISFLTNDIRAQRNENADFFKKLFAGNSSTNIYNAINLQLNYTFLKNTLGLAYERIDPEYKTLGAYYFNNDYENITMNYSRPFFKDKANIAIRFGIQRDDLNNMKEEKSNRYVGSLNFNYNPTEQLQTTLSYTSFQSYRNLKSQFDYINELSPYDNMDTLRFAQLSQNIDASVNYNFSKTETKNQTINFMVSYQEAANRQGNVSLPGNVTRFMNTALGYALQLIPQCVNINTSLNGTYNYVNSKNGFTFGPVLALTAGFFKNTLTTGLSTSYNANLVSSLGVQAQVTSVRVNAAYKLKKKHNFNGSAIWQNRQLKAKSTSNSLTAQITYSFNF
jgi:hypothetical protein